MLISILYVQYNAVVTAFLVGDEWSRFATADLSGRNASHAKFLEHREKADIHASKVPRSWILRASAKLRTFVGFTERLWPAGNDVLRRMRRKISPATGLMKNIVKLSSLRRMVPKIHRWLFPVETIEDRVRKTLRVSDPEGIQRSSYFVSMPWRYGLPLIFSTASLHWLVSQSIFVYSVDLYKPDGMLDPKYGLYSGAGFSIEPIICCR